MTNIIDQIVKYRNQRPEIKLAEHLTYIPRRDDSAIVGQVAYYENPDSRLRTMVNFMEDFCIEFDYILMQNLAPREYKVIQESIYSATEMIQKNYIHPFLLIVNGRFIPWEYITIISVTEKYYMLVHGIDLSTFNSYFFGDLTSINLIILPQDISYIDDSTGSSSVSERTMFAFDDAGTFIPTGTARYIINSDDEDLVIVNGNPDSSKLFKISDDLKYSVFPEFVFPFRKSSSKYYFAYTNEISTLGTYAKIVGSATSTYVKAFYTKKATPIYDHFHKVDYAYVEDQIKASLTGQTEEAYFTILKNAFDLPIDKDKSWEENRNDSLDYIAKYDSRLFNEYYKEHKQFIVRHVDYAWIQSHRDNAGYFRIPRRFTLHHNFYILIFRNGELMKSNQLAQYKGHDFVMPVDEFVNGDSIEIWYFIGAKNHAYDMKISSTQPYIPLDQDYFYIKDDMAIYSSQTDKHNFSYPGDGLQNFKVPYTIQNKSSSDHRQIRVRFSNSFYYDKDLIMASGNRFAYYSMNIYPTSTETDYVNFFKIDLGTHFMHCNEYDRYLVFYNGRRLSNDQYRLVLPGSDGLPFYRYQVYIGKPMKKGDRIDVVYLPHYCLDIDTTSITFDANGFLTVPKNKIWAALDNEIYTYWFNGKKVDQKDVLPISANKVRITKNQKTKKTPRVTLMLELKEEYEELKDRFTTYSSQWDNLLSSVSIMDLLGLPTVSYTNTEAVYFTEAFGMKALMKEVLRDWYIANPYADPTKPFYYEYANVDKVMTTGAIHDSKDMVVLEAIDCNTSDNLDVSRPYM